MSIMKIEDIDYLKNIFSDLINYEEEDPLAPIDPFSYKTPEGDSCLHIAAMRGDSRAISLLLDGGIDINSIGDMGNTALHYSSRMRHRDVFDLLISRGANLLIKNEFGKMSGDYAQAGQ